MDDTARMQQTIEDERILLSHKMLSFLQDTS